MLLKEKTTTQWRHYFNMVQAHGQLNTTITQTSSKATAFK